MTAGKRGKRTDSKRGVCISDRKDLDGVGAAALVKRATNASCLLVNRTDLWKALEDVSTDDALDSLYVCDFGISKADYDRFVETSSLICERASMTYIDHHMVDKALLDRLEKAGVVVEHSMAECSTVLAYKAFQGVLPREASFVAACAAVTDYKDDGPLGSQLIKHHDRLFVMFEATTALHHIDAIQDSDTDLALMVEHLAKMGYPHQIPGAMTNAGLQADVLVARISRIGENHTKMRHLAYVEVESNASGIVNSLLGMSGKGVAVAYRTAMDGWHAVSVRGYADRIHLGVLVDSLASGMGGRGGGHKHACGASIPPGWMREFLTRLDSHLGR